MMVNVYSNIAILFLSANLCGMERMSPEKALELMRAHHEEIDRAFLCNRLPAQFNWLPREYIIKPRAKARIEGERIFRDCITEYNLNALVVPRHWQHTQGEDPFQSDLCLCEYIEGDHAGIITLPLMEQLITLITKAKKPYWDLHPGNIVFLTPAKIALIDTEYFLPQNIPAFCRMALEKFINENHQIAAEAHTLLLQTINDLKRP